mgnify:FL=1
MNLSAWGLSIVGIVVLTLMVDIIIPEGKTGKYIKGVFAMLTVFVIAMPLPKIFNSEFDLEEFLQQNTSASADYDVLENIYYMRLERLEQKIITSAESEGIKNMEVKINALNNNSFVEIQSIEINLKNVVIEEKNPNINIVDIVIDLVSKAAETDKSAVKVYE